MRMVMRLPSGYVDGGRKTKPSGQPIPLPALKFLRHMQPAISVDGAIALRRRTYLEYAAIIRTRSRRAKKAFDFPIVMGGEEGRLLGVTQVCSWSPGGVGLPFKVSQCGEPPKNEHTGHSCLSFTPLRSLILSPCSLFFVSRRPVFSHLSQDMWADDEYWMPLFLEGKSFRGEFHFSDEQTILRHVLEAVTPQEMMELVL